jgi:hypothetical protein
MTNYLSPNMLSAMRSLLDGSQKINKRTANALINRQWAYPVGDLGHIALTVEGERYITNYVETTGDGPEDLKAMFRFGS